MNGLKSNECGQRLGSEAGVAWKHLACALSWAPLTTWTTGCAPSWALSYATCKVLAGVKVVSVRRSLRHEAWAILARCIIVSSSFICVARQLGLLLDASHISDKGAKWLSRTQCRVACALEVAAFEPP